MKYLIHSSDQDSCLDLQPRLFIVPSFLQKFSRKPLPIAFKYRSVLYSYEFFKYLMSSLILFLFIHVVFYGILAITSCFFNEMTIPYFIPSSRDFSSHTGPT